MAFKARGGFVIRPVVTADSIRQIEDRLTQVEVKLNPATVISSNLVKLTEMTFDLTLVFSAFVRPLTIDDLELISCQASNFRRLSNTTAVIKLTAISPTQFSYRLKDDVIAQKFIGTTLVTKVADVVRLVGIETEPFDGFMFHLDTIGNPIRFGLRRKTLGIGSNVVSYAQSGLLYVDIFGLRRETLGIGSSLESYTANGVGSIYVDIFFNTLVATNNSNFEELYTPSSFSVLSSVMFLDFLDVNGHSFDAAPVAAPAGRHTVIVNDDGFRIVPANWEPVVYTMVY